MRRAAIALTLLAGLAWPGAALATPPLVTAAAEPSSGAAPLVVTLTAGGDDATYQWDLGHGSTATGATVRHTFGVGTHTATVTATAPDGETAQAQVQVTAFAVTLHAPRSAVYGAGALFTGRLSPARTGAPVTILAGTRHVITVRTNARGAYHARIRIGDPGPYTARAHGAVSPKQLVRVGSTIDASITGAGIVGSPLTLRAEATPRSAGKLRVRISRNGSRTFDRVYTGRAGVQLGTSAASAYVVSVTLVPARGYSAPGRLLRATVYQPSLAMGSRGPSVLALERRLYELHYALRGVDSYYDYDTRDAVYAFQKLYGLNRTGAVDATFWRLLERATVPAARYAGDHIEVNKTRQVLFVVRGGKVILISHVSTGATGNTPLGIWHVYAKTPGWLPDGMFDSSFFLRGFAVHGYPEVPPYPASHGCVRAPVWLAPRLYSYIPWGSAIIIYD